MEAIFGEREREFPVIQRELKEFDGIKSTEMYKVGGNKHSSGMMA